MQSGSLRLLDVTSIPGLGGPSGWFSCTTPGADGRPYALGPSVTRTDYAGVGPSFVAPAVAYENTTVTLTAVGEANDTVLMLTGPTAFRRSLPALVGDLLIGGPVGSVQRTLLGQGTVSVQLPLPALAPFETLALHLQTTHLRQGNVIFGPPRVLTAIDDAY